MVRTTTLAASKKASAAKKGSSGKSPPVQSKSKVSARGKPPAAGKKTPRPGNGSATEAARPTAAAGKKPASDKKTPKLPFARGDYVVYPTHGVGKVTGVKRQKIAGFDLQLFEIVFDSDKLIIRVPVDKTTQAGLRKISTKGKMDNVVTALKGRARSRRTMWSRRAQEYDSKINSGDPVAVAEVVRDLYRSPNQPEQSYSERQMYETALGRLVQEFALVQKLDVEAATAKIEQILAG